MANKKLIFILMTTLTSFAGQARDYTCGNLLDAYDRSKDLMLMPSERSHAKRVVTNLLDKREQEFQKQASDQQKEVMDLFIKNNRFLRTNLEVALINQCNKRIDEDFLDVALDSDVNYIKPILNHPGYYRCGDINTNVNYEWMSDFGVSLLKFGGPLVKNGRVLIYKKSDEEAGLSLDEAKTLTAKNCARYDDSLPLYLSFREVIFDHLEKQKQNEIKITKLKTAIYSDQKFIANRDYHQPLSEISRNVERFSNYEHSRKFRKLAIALYANIERDVLYLAENNYQIGSNQFADLFDENHRMNSMVDLELLFKEMRWQIKTLKEKEFKPDFDTSKAAFAKVVSSSFKDIKTGYQQRTQSEMLKAKVAAMEKKILDAGYERHWRSISEITYQISDALGDTAGKTFADKIDRKEQQVQEEINLLVSNPNNAPTNEKLINEQGILYSAIESFSYLQGANYLLNDIKNAGTEEERSKAKAKLNTFINQDFSSARKIYLDKKAQEDEQERARLAEEKKQRETDELIKKLVKEEKVKQEYQINIHQISNTFRKIKGHLNNPKLAEKFRLEINSAIAKAEKDVKVVAVNRYFDSLKDVENLFNKQGKLKSVVYLNNLITKSDKLMRDTESAFQYQFGTGGYDDARSELTHFISNI